MRERPTIQSSKDSYSYIYAEIADLAHEEFFVLYLNRANKVVAHRHISRGGISGTVADTKIILKHGIEILASAMIAVHNHPSGNIKPSQSDIELTRRLKDAARLIDIILIDHLIIGEKKYYSFADEGMI